MNSLENCYPTVFNSGIVLFQFAGFPGICNFMTLNHVDTMKISIGNDHAGTEYKLAILGLLKSMGKEVINHGTDGTDSVDYPDFIHPVADDVEQGRADYGVIVCGSGNGATMTANKHQKVRCALCWNKEIVQLARAHNDANILSLPARFIALPQALDMVRTFFDTEFAGGRHERRIEKIPCR